MASPLPTEEPPDDDDDNFAEDRDVRGRGRRDSHRGGVVVHHHRDDDDDEDYDYEATGLVTAEPLTKDEFSVMSIMDYGHDNDTDNDDEERVCSGSFRILVLSMGCILVVALLAVLLPGIRNKSDALEVLRTPARIPVEYKCQTENSEGGGGAATATLAENYDPDMTESYVKETEQITNNMTEFLQQFRENKFDDWGKTYQEVKAGMYHFKSTYYPPYLQDGSTIYESACGIGLNLYMTLEILQETHGIENLFVYGNELLEVSADKANAVMDHIAPAMARKGIICPADSSHLEFVPANSFDLVYTGYIR